MNKTFSSTLGLASLFFLLPFAHGQAVPTASKQGLLEAGAGVTYLNNDYSPRKNGGVVAWADYDFLRFFHVNIGADLQLNFDGIISPDDIGENSYLIGPRFSHRFFGKYQVIGKIDFGRATISNQFYKTSSAFNILAFGGGVDYHLARHYNIRVEVDEQKWGDFEPHTLSPFMVSAGVLYIIR